MDVSIDNSSKDYISVVLKGAYNVHELENTMVLLRTEATESGMSRILVDAHQLENPRIDFDRFRVGVAIAEHAHPSLKIACYLRDDAINHFGEHTAVNRGAQYKVFDDKQTALEWLMSAT